MDTIPERLALAVNRLLNRYLVRGADGQNRPIPYNPVDYQSLRFLAANPGARATDLAGHLGVAPTTMQSALDRLRARGLITKRASETDRRARAYALSEQGARVHAAIEAQDRANMAEIVSSLSPSERATLADLLERLSA